MRLHGTHYGRGRGKSDQEACSSADKEGAPPRGESEADEGEKEGARGSRQHKRQSGGSKQKQLARLQQSWEPARPAVAVTGAPFCSCSNSLCRNDSTSRQAEPAAAGAACAQTDRGALRPNQRHAKQNGQQPFHTCFEAVAGPGSV